MFATAEKLQHYFLKIDQWPILSRKLLEHLFKLIFLNTALGAEMAPAQAPKKSRIQSRWLRLRLWLYSPAFNPSTKKLIFCQCKSVGVKDFRGLAFTSVLSVITFSS